MFSSLCAFALARPSDNKPSPLCRRSSLGIVPSYLRRCSHSPQPTATTSTSTADRLASPLCSLAFAAPLAPLASLHCFPTAIAITRQRRHQQPCSAHGLGLPIRNSHCRCKVPTHIRQLKQLLCL